MSQSRIDRNHDPALAGVARAIEFLASRSSSQPSMAEAARVAGYSPEAFSRVFRRHVGVSPKRFLEHLTVERLKRRILSGVDLLEAQFETGLSSPGRIHDHFVQLEAVTPGEYRRLGEGLVVRYGFCSSAHGPCLLASTERGLAFLAFTLFTGAETAFEQMRGCWPRARLVEDPAGVEPMFSRVFPKSDKADGKSRDGALCVHVRGTNFQVQVWRALLRIPPGAVTTYGELASTLGRAGGSRAVAGAVAANPVALVIPCHRVIRASGALAGYRWNPAVKASLLVEERPD